MDGKKEDVFSEKWALIVLHSWCPSYDEQIARARAWGLNKRLAVLDGEEVDLSAICVEDLRRVKRTTNWPSQMGERQLWFERLKALRVPGHEVFFATPLCVGFSGKVARWTVEQVFDAGLDIYVHTVHGNGAAIYRAGDDMTEFYEAVDKAANAAHQAANRARKSKRDL